MGFIEKLKVLAGVLRRAKRPPDTLRLLRQRKPLLLGVNLFELAMLVSGRVDARVKALAQIKTSALIGCPF